MPRIVSLACSLGVFALAAVVTLGQEPDPRLLKTATIQWVADGPPLVYDIRFAGGDSTTMPTALKYLVKDLALSDGWYLTGDDKSKTVGSLSKRMSLDYTAAKSKLQPVRIAKIDVKEGATLVGCTVAFSKKPAAEDVKRTQGILETFTRKYMKLAKGAALAVDHGSTTKTTVVVFELRFKDLAKEAAKEKK